MTYWNILDVLTRTFGGNWSWRAY